MQHQIAIYSPHTAHDAWSEGVNTWLISAITNGEKTLPISPSSDNREMYEVSGILNESANMKQFKKAFRKINIGNSLLFRTSKDWSLSFDRLKVITLCYITYV